jgi:hypothetical protein
MNIQDKPKTTWNIIKTITNNHKKSNSMLMMEIEGKLTTHHQSIAEKFNTYYISVANNIINSNQAKNTTDDPQNTTDDPQNTTDDTQNTTDDPNKTDPISYLYSAFQQPFANIRLKSTTTGEIEKIITELKHKESCGYDEVTIKILKTVSPFIVSPLTHICNRMLSTGIFLDRLK